MPDVRKEVEDLKEENEQLSKRVSTIEGYFKTAFIVAVIFGIAGSFGYIMLSSSYLRLKDLQERTDTFRKEVEPLLNNTKVVIQAVKDSIKAQEKNALATLENSVSTILGSYAKGELEGEWFFMGDEIKPCAIFQQGRLLIAVSEVGNYGIGFVRNPQSFDIPEWSDKVTLNDRAIVKENGNKIEWKNGFFWTRNSRNKK